MLRLIPIICICSSSTVIDSDDELIEIRDSSDSEGSVRGRGTNANGKRPNKRAKTRSLTPPPPMPQFQKDQARAMVRQILREQNPRSALDEPVIHPLRSGGQSEDLLAAEDFDPEMAKLIEKIKTQYKPNTQAQSSSTIRGGGSTDGGNVKIVVKWIPHPEDDFARSMPAEEFPYTIGRVIPLLFRRADNSLILLLIAFSIF